MLQELAGGPNIMALTDCVRDEGTHTPAFVFEAAMPCDLKQLYPSLTHAEMRFYMLQILRVRGTRGG